MILRNFIDKCLSLSRLKERWFDNLISGVVEAARTISYVETTIPSQSDCFHISVKQCDNKTFMHEYENITRFALVKLGLRRVKIGFDTTEDPTWCESGFMNLRPSVYDHPLMSWQFLNVSIVEPFYLPLMSIPYRQIDDLDSLVIDLLNYIKTLPIIVDLILFDRGFYHAHLIDYMNSIKTGNPWPYLMLVPQREPQEDYIQQTRDAGLIFASYKHTFDYPKEKSTWKPSTTIMVKIVGDKVAWCYATNQKPSLSLCMIYPKRWTLETGFRIHDEARIKSESRLLKIRFFYHLISMLMIILWRLQNSVIYSVFKRYLKWLEYQFYSSEIKEVVPPPPLL